MLQHIQQNPKNLIFSMLLLILSLNCIAQNTLTYNESNGSPKASLNAIQWIEGYWKGEALGGVTEEVWAPPLGNSMMCAFKLTVNNKVKFYELVTITAENETLILRLKHFHGDLKGWEEKDKTIDFKLVKVTSNRVYFDGFTFEKMSNTEINIYVVFKQKGKRTEAKFNYKKYKH